MATIKQLKSLKSGMPIKYGKEKLQFRKLTKIKDMYFVEVITPRFGRLSIFGKSQIRRIKVPKKITHKVGYVDYKW